MDLRKKRVDGIEGTRRLSALGAPPVLALTSFKRRRVAFWRTACRVSGQRATSADLS